MLDSSAVIGIVPESNEIDPPFFTSARPGCESWLWFGLPIVSLSFSVVPLPSSSFFSSSTTPTTPLIPLFFHHPLLFIPPPPHPPHPHPLAQSFHLHSLQHIAYQQSIHLPSPLPILSLLPPLPPLPVVVLITTNIFSNSLLRKRSLVHVVRD